MAKSSSRKRGSAATRTRSRPVSKLDAAISDLIQERACAYQREQGVPAKDRGEVSRSALKAIFTEIQSACAATVDDVVVAYLGPEATFTHQAALKQFGSSAKFSPQRTIADVFAEVTAGFAKFGVVPVENSTEGAVTHTLDMFVDSDVRIVAQVVLKIEHYLASRSKSKGRLQTLFAHPQSLGQCRAFIEKHLPSLEIIETSSNARSAELAKADATAAAITTELAARRHRLHILERSIHDNASNATRFLVLGQEMPAPTGDDRTSLMLSVKHTVGALHHALEPFSQFGINMTKIESRPSKRRAWEYLFFVDCDGHVQEPTVAKAIEHFHEHCQFVKVLGSYPK